MKSKRTRRSTYRLFSLFLALTVVWLLLAFFEAWPGPTILMGGAFGFVFSSLTIAWEGLIVTRQCPRCRNTTLKRLARARRFHECVECRARFKRAYLNAEWEDASGPEAEAFYHRPSKSGRWIAYAPPSPGKTGIGALLRNKWSRNRSGPIKPVAQSLPRSARDSLHDPWLDD